jgi:hypothetical protein
MIWYSYFILDSLNLFEITLVTENNLQAMQYYWWSVVAEWLGCRTLNHLSRGSWVRIPAKAWRGEQDTLISTARGSHDISRIPCGTRP